MGLRRALARLAAAAEAPVFPVIGAGGRSVAGEIALLGGVRVVDSPRAANVLLVVGGITPGLLAPLLQVHDQLPTPRATVWWPGEPVEHQDLRTVLGEVVVARPGDGDTLRGVFAELVGGGRLSDPPALPDDEPAEWRGVGPYGQGGTGMTGGVPYGRPLAKRSPDPDGLELDQLPLRIGPMFPPLPPGLILDIALQGDVIREVAVGDNPFLGHPDGPAPAGLDTALFLEAARRPQPVATIELARARHHLRWAAGTLRLHGLASESLRVLRLARALRPEHALEVETLARRLRGRRSLSWATRGVGVVTPAQVGFGPVARAAGVAVDARLDDPAYDGIGFSPVVNDGGDARARLRQRLAEAAQALDLANRAGARVRQPGPALEGPRGPLSAGEALPSAALVDLLPRLLVGQEWGDAMTTVASLDLDLEEAAAGARAGAPA
ncbi:MAG: hypothetical protein KY458_02875 [Actinobacteria bacterium]|nr:hypothetical protein [Actinomycetota bacterium]